VLKQIINQENDSGNAGDAAKTPESKPQSPSQGSSPAPMSSNKNILSSDVEIKGTLRFANDLIIDGRIEGEVNSEGDLTVGENAHILGNINTRSVTVFGKVQGNITVTDRCELKQNAALQGDIAAGKLAIEEGASYIGASRVGSPMSGGGSSSVVKSSSSTPSKDSDSDGGDDKGGGS